MPALPAMREGSGWRSRASACRAFASRLSDIGTHAYPPHVRRRLKLLNFMAGLVVFFSLMFAADYAMSDARAHAWLIVINLALVVIALSVPLLHRVSDVAGALVLMGAEYVGLFALVALIGRTSGIQLNMIVVAAVAFSVLGAGHMRLFLTVLIAGLILHAAAWFLFPVGLLPIDPFLVNRLYLSSAITVFAATATAAYIGLTLIEQAEAETEAMLRNILPDTIVQQLRDRPGELVAASHPDVTVLFSDIKSFVPLSKSLGAARTVEMLNVMVSGFDRLATGFGVEKIKTIGDAYMAVAGLPEPVADHADRQARLALAMHEHARETGWRFGVAVTLRIGIASGPVMAGVIGTRKFSYDVWGDTVNLASRLESTCDADGVHVSPATRERLGDGFRLRARGPVEIKGLGRLDTYALLGPDVAEADASPATSRAAAE